MHRHSRHGRASRHAGHRIWRAEGTPVPALGLRSGDTTPQLRGLVSVMTTLAVLALLGVVWDIVGPRISAYQHAGPGTEPHTRQGRHGTENALHGQRIHQVAGARQLQV